MRVDPLRLLIVVALTAVLGVKLAYWLAEDGRAQPERPVGTSSIAGRVLDDAGAPVAGARVQASRRSGAFSIAAVTDAAGHFALENLPDGSYRLLAEKAGYLGDRGNYFQRQRFEFPVRTVTIAAGEAAAGVDVSVIRGAALAGTVYDEDGRPAARRYVRVLSRDSAFDDPAWRDAAPIGATDEAGRFRIGSLPPGEYYVMAGLATNGERRVYYPNAVRVKDASSIVLALGEARDDLILRARSVETSTVDGVVRRPDGAPVAAVRVDLISRGGYEPDDRRRFVTSDADGRFTFSGVAADDYLVVAHAQAGSAWPGASPGSHVWAMTTVVSNGREPGAIELTLEPGHRLSGRIEFHSMDGSKPAAIDHAPVWLGAADAATQAMLQSGNRIEAPLDRDGRFSFDGVPAGRYRLTARFVEEPWHVESAAAGGVDYLDAPLTIANAAPPVLTVTLVDREAQLAGVVRTTSGTAAGDQLVIVFPADATQWDRISRRVQVALADPSGRYALSRVPAGEYLVAVGPAGLARTYTRSMFQALAGGATRVKLERGQQKTLDLTAQ